MSAEIKALERKDVFGFRTQLEGLAFDWVIVTRIKAKMGTDAGRFVDMVVAH